MTGGADKLVKLWEITDEGMVERGQLGEHADWVRDVAWSNNLGIMSDLIASCSEDKKVRIYKRSHTAKPHAEDFK